MSMEPNDHSEEMMTNLLLEQWPINHDPLITPTTTTPGDVPIFIFIFTFTS